MAKPNLRKLGSSHEDILRKSKVYFTRRRIIRFLLSLLIPWLLYLVTMQTKIDPELKIKPNTNSFDFDFYTKLPAEKIIASINNEDLIIVVASFKQISRAKSLITQLKIKNIAQIRHDRFNNKYGDWHRVYLGPFVKLEQAINTLDKLLKLGFKGAIIKKN